MNTRYTDMQHILLKNLQAGHDFLVKLQDLCASQGKSESELIDGRLAADMFPFVRQIQIMSDNAKAAIARLADKEAPQMEDNEKTLEELKHRLTRTIAYLETFSAEDFAEADTRQVVRPYFPGKYQHGEDYLIEFVYANFFFHYAVAYAIARMQGFEIGKADFIGGLTFHPLAE